MEYYVTTKSIFGNMRKYNIMLRKIQDNVKQNVKDKAQKKGLKEIKLNPFLPPGP